MRRLFLSVLSLVAFVGSAVEVTKEWRIVVPPATKNYEKVIGAAAREVQRDLERALGYRLAITQDDTVAQGLFIGADFARAAGLSFDGFKYWDNAYAEKDGRIYCYGKDRSGRTEASPSDFSCVVAPSARAALRFRLSVSSSENSDSLRQIGCRVDKTRRTTRRHM